MYAACVPMLIRHHACSLKSLTLTNFEPAKGSIRYTNIADFSALCLTHCGWWTNGILPVSQSTNQCFQMWAEPLIVNVKAIYY